MRKLKGIPVAVWPAVMVLAVVALAVAVAVGAEVVRLDTIANRTVHNHAAEPLTEWVFVITTLGATPVLIGVTLSAAIALALNGHRRSALALVAAYAITDATVAIAKLIVSRPRPDESLTEASGFSFPSGHSAMSMAVYGCLAFALARAARNRLSRAAVAVCGLAIVVMVGLSRIYLGVHYPTDVIAGWTTGAAIAIAVWVVLGRTQRSRAAAATS